jgi:metal-sulfur cluster biosynthetic enzyme
MDEREFTMTEDASATPGATSFAEQGDPPVSDGDAGDGTDGVTTETVREALKQVFDPELGLNIVDLGLVYDIQVDEHGDVDIQYSLTTMGCPIGPLIEDQMRAFLAPLGGIGEVRPEFVIRPPWTPEMMSDEAKAALGVF